ncbi:hypothetical protein F53441_4910 [Fusarium austroafricanum]|uniref:Zn(2)-C6 fungal-type domain-containing protein n=1 Tax=Fusarium austroafricanum TaxID=2364996 RepID=A0A8H4KLT0_9HYPO|nr:hypothetical protein F53441_4910 [Fusarium austroafricanum]
MPAHRTRSQNIAAKRAQLPGVDGPARRACVNCRQRKIRCDIVSNGVPCTNCRTHDRPGCRMCPNKKEARQLVQPAVLAPLRPREFTDSPATASSITTEPAVSTAKEDMEQDLGAHLLNRNDTRDAALDHRTRSHFIGTELSNCHYLVRQGSSHINNRVFHFNNGQLEPGEGWYERHGVPGELLQRPDKQLEMRLIRAYFDLINCGWPIVDEELFMWQYHGHDSNNPVCLTLLNAMLLVGAHALASHDETMSQLMTIFFKRAKALVECDSWHDRLVYIQVPLLMTWYSDANAWYWIGMATRTAMALGLHRDASHSKMLPVHKHMFTRLWWVLFQFDTISATSAGRPQVINLADSDTPDLQNSDFEGLPGAEIDFVIYHVKLCKIISQTIRDGWSPRASIETRLEAIRKADESLGHLMLTIPEGLELKLSSLDTWQAVFHLTHYNFILLTHRPAPSPTTKDQFIGSHEDAIICREATVTIASIFDVLLGKRTTSLLWLYSNHVLFTATIYILNQISTSKPLLAAKSRSILETFLASLRDLAKYWTYAKGLLQILEQRASRLRSERIDAASTIPQGTTDSHPSSTVDKSSYEHPIEGSSSWNSKDIQAMNNPSADLTGLGSDNYIAATGDNTSMDFLVASQDPSVNDLLFLDNSAFDFLFYDNIG